MKSSGIMCGLVSVVVLTALTVSIGPLGSRSQEKPEGQDSPTPTPESPYIDLSKYAVADFDATLPANVVEREQRKLKSRRYDNWEWVLKNPHPETARVGLYQESIPEPLVPAVESDLIVTGNVTAVTAHLSNDMGGVYSEFTIKIDQKLKGDSFIDIEPESSITIDRAGGYVRYPNGQMVLYTIAGKQLPTVGCYYVFFLRNDKKSKNFEILNVYELQESHVIPLDSGRSAEEIKGMKKLDFINVIRNKLSQLSVDVRGRRKLFSVKRNTEPNPESAIRPGSL